MNRIPDWRISGTRRDSFAGTLHALGLDDSLRNQVWATAPSGSLTVTRPGQQTVSQSE